MNLNDVLQQGKRGCKSKRPQPTDLSRERKQISMWKFRWWQIPRGDSGSYLHESSDPHALQFRSATPAQFRPSARAQRLHQQLGHSEPPPLFHARRPSQPHDGQPGGTWIIRKDRNIWLSSPYTVFVSIYQTFYYSSLKDVIAKQFSETTVPDDGPTWITMLPSTITVTF